MPLCRYISIAAQYFSSFCSACSSLPVAVPLPMQTWVKPTSRLPSISVRTIAHQLRHYPNIPALPGSPIPPLALEFVHNVNGNPEGVYPAQGTATVLWPDGNVNVTANTTSDGLAIFPVSVANKSADLYKIILVTVAFQGPQGVPPCDVTVDRAAFFTLVKSLPAASATAGASPTAISTATATATNSPTPTPTPKPCPTVNPKRTPTPCP